jgi:hypothetical protein
MNGSDDCVPSSANSAAEVEYVEDLRKGNVVGYNGRSEGLPISIIMAVQSRGLKNRVVTRSHPGLNLIGHQIFSKMFDYLSTHPCCKSVFAGARLESIKDEIKLSTEPDSEFISADLSAATDRIDFKTARALWSAFEPMLDPYERQSLDYLLGP